MKSFFRRSPRALAAPSPVATRPNSVTPSQPPAVEIDEAFESLEQWLEWANAHPSVYDEASGQAIGRRIIANGFVEPLTGRVVRSDMLNPLEELWREGVAAHGINSRVRGVMRLIELALQGRSSWEPRIYATEAVTPFALTLRGMFPRFIGSEFGLDEAARSELYPITHQDLTALTLRSDTFDIVSTNEVLEHVPDLDAALREIVRVLKPGGWHIGTHPFRFMSPESDLRTKIVDGKLVHLKEPEYHGNPVDAAGGSLVFETPGWDIIERARSAGFGTVSMRFIASERFGFLTENTGVFVLCAQK